MSISDIIFYLKEIDKKLLVNSPHDRAVQEAIKLLLKIKEKVNNGKS